MSNSASMRSAIENRLHIQHCRVLLFCFVLVFPQLLNREGVLAQAGGLTIFGNVNIDASQLEDRLPPQLDLLLYSGGNVIARQTININTGYRFTNLTLGVFDIAIVVENREVARVSKVITTVVSNQVQWDINLALRKPPGPKVNSDRVVSAEDSYDRHGRNRSLFEKAVSDVASKNYADAITSLRELVSLDRSDYPAWYQLGVVYFVRKEYDDAEKCFINSLTAHSSYLPAAFNLGRVRLAKKNYQEAVESLEQALKIDSEFAPANYFLGEAYLQLKKGSIAVKYFDTALKLDPIGMADAHLRLASLYDLAGYKDRAAAEYEQFLTKKADYPEKKKLEEYIQANKPKP